MPVTPSTKKAKGNPNPEMGDRKLLEQKRANPYLKLTEAERKRLIRLAEQLEKFNPMFGKPATLNGKATLASPSPYQAWLATPKNQQSAIVSKLFPTPAYGNFKDVGKIPLKPSWYGGEAMNGRGMVVSIPHVLDRTARDLITGRSTWSELVQSAKTHYPKVNVSPRTVIPKKAVIQNGAKRMVPSPEDSYRVFEGKPANLSQLLTNNLGKLLVQTIEKTPKKAPKIPWIPNKKDL